MLITFKRFKIFHLKLNADLGYNESNSVIIVYIKKKRKVEQIRKIGFRTMSL